MFILSGNAHAEMSVEMSHSGYYTDDVALFSVTRRLSLKDDPTQPIVDRPNQGGDFVYEPSLKLEGTADNFLGKMAISFDAGGYIFANRSEFTHSLYEFQLSQIFSTDTKIAFHYNYVPTLYLGKNRFVQVNGIEMESDEKLSSHYGSLHIEQPLNDKLTFRLLGRYGERNYNAPFQHRNTQFWTIGTHLEWQISSGIELLWGYHYERGLANPQKANHFPDDISFVNHYTSAELKINVLPKLTASLIVDYEKNIFTTTNSDDEHRDKQENLYQTEIELLYELNHASTIKLGWQRGNRKLTHESQIKNNNIWLGFDYTF